VNEETEKTILRRLANLESHIINLIHPIHQISELLTNSDELKRFEKILSQPLRLEDNGLRYLLKELEGCLKQVNKNMEKLDTVQTYGEIKFIGKKLHQIEADISEIKKDGIKRKVDLSFSCDGYEMVKIEPVIQPLRKITKNNIKPVSLEELYELMGFTELQINILNKRLGLSGENAGTFISIAKTYKISYSSCRANFLRSIRKLRNPSRRSLLKACMNKELIKKVLVEE